MQGWEGGDAARLAHSFPGWQDRFPRATVALQIAELQFGGLLLIDPNGTSLVIGIVSKTAPPSSLRLQHQPALDRIAVDVAEFLQPLGMAPDHEIVEPPLPHLSFRQYLIPELGRPSPYSSAVISDKASLST